MAEQCLLCERKFSLDNAEVDVRIPLAPAEFDPELGALVYRKTKAVSLCQECARAVAADYRSQEE